MSEFLISAVICTYNPRRDHLERALQSLKNQTLPLADWELVIVDNSSKTPVASFLDLSWHPQGRIVVEKKQGLTHARICGVKNTRAPIILYVDDDNVLASDYLAQAFAIGRDFPQLGTWGSAVIAPEYEKQPAPELMPFCEVLALKNVDRDLWSNLPRLSEADPYGAGIVVRRPIAEAFADRKEKGGFTFGRSGSNLLSAEDRELSLVATEEGKGYGVFRSLSLTHLISARRVERDYLLRLCEAIEMSNYLLLLLRQQTPGALQFSYLGILREFLSLIYKMITGRGAARAFFFRVIIGKWKALRMYRRLKVE